MSNKSNACVPSAVPITEALRQSQPLASLRHRIAESNKRYSAIQSVVPPQLAVHTAAGALDDAGWTLIAGTTAVAAKLRQLQPLLEAQLKHQGFSVSAVRIKVRSG